MSSSGDELERDLPAADKEIPKAEEPVQKEEPKPDESKPEESEAKAKQPLKPPGARAIPGMGMAMPGMGGGNILAEMKQQQRRRSSNKTLVRTKDRDREGGVGEVESVPWMGMGTGFLRLGGSGHLIRFW